jgi:hypothetical protein
MRPAYWTRRPLKAIGAARNSCVQRRAVEALADVRAGGDDEQRRQAGLGIEPGEGGGAGLGAHAAA